MREVQFVRGSCRPSTPVVVPSQLPSLYSPDTNTLPYCHVLGLKMYIPAFFSCTVNSFQSTFMRSLKAIHKSACSCGGIASHRFSMLAKVGLLIACACLDCWQSGVRRAAAVREVGRVVGRERAERRSDWRSMVCGSGAERGCGGGLVIEAVPASIDQGQLCWRACEGSEVFQQWQNCSRRIPSSFGRARKLLAALPGTPLGAPLIGRHPRQQFPVNFNGIAISIPATPRRRPSPGFRIWR